MAHILTVKSAVSGDRVKCLVLGDRSLSKHLSHSHVKGSNFSLLYVETYVIDVVCGSYFDSEKCCEWRPS